MMFSALFQPRPLSRRSRHTGGLLGYIFVTGQPGQSMTNSRRVWMNALKNLMFAVAGCRRNKALCTCKPVNVKDDPSLPQWSPT
jgi:hypothetical protein